MTYAKLALLFLAIALLVGCGSVTHPKRGPIHDQPYPIYMGEWTDHSPRRCYSWDCTYY